MQTITTKFGLGFGILNPTLGKQLKAQKLKFDASEMKRFEANRSSINDLDWSGLITDSQAFAFKNKLMKQITRHLIRMNKTK